MYQPYPDSNPSSISLTVSEIQTPIFLANFTASQKVFPTALKLVPAFLAMYLSHPTSNSISISLRISDIKTSTSFVNYTASQRFSFGFNPSYSSEIWLTTGNFGLQLRILIYKSPKIVLRNRNSWVQRGIHGYGSEFRVTTWFQTFISDFLDPKLGTPWSCCQLVAGQRSFDIKTVGERYDPAGIRSRVEPRRRITNSPLYPLSHSRS